MLRYRCGRGNAERNIRESERKRRKKTERKRWRMEHARTIARDDRKRETESSIAIAVAACKSEVTATVW